MSDERFEAWLREAAKGYNRPPDIPPREDMWDNIRVEGRGPRDERPDRGLAIGDRRFAIGRIWTLAAAASLLLAAGIGLGYWARGGSVPTQISDIRAPLPAAPESSLAQTPSVPSPRPSIPGVQPSPPSLAGDEPATTTPTGYDVLANQTLTAAEALLVSFRTSEDTAFDDLMRRWSRELLSTTRLLLESPAAQDVQRRRLLEDLELVLVQMGQLPAADAALERDLVKRAITRRQVLTRIRTSIPAGASSGT